MVIIWGQCLGLNPVTGILQKDVSKMRYTKCSFQYLYATTIALIQIVATLINVYRLYMDPNVDIVGPLTFFTPLCLTTLFFIRTASKWIPLMNELVDSRLDEYIQPNVIKQCNITCALYLVTCIVEHLMSILSNAVHILQCVEEKVDFVEEYVRRIAAWLYELNVPNNRWFGIILQYLNILNTATWNYVDIFIVCISLYLASIIEQINKKIIATANKNYVPESTWASLRKDYNRVTNLIKLFDDSFCGLVLIAFGSDLCSICLQLYHVIAKVIRSPQLIDKICPGNDSSVYRIVYPLYVSYSTIFLVARFLAMSLVASGVHSSSLVSLRALYSVPTTSYCKEVERFQNQVDSDTVALSGLHLFYITKNLILTVSGTILTYELVLLQYNS
ncbi:hypothetical protein PYW08_014282 [Mythimna loreyi]|uniref:Uncharacterized protein n=1 Tax=Mythimna loreyi TaxID=667449 RepID=A0ACC2RB28_9NEOP|nr:hypothetical protein PYW08_014282 [Mythimna loreyi]